MEGLKHHIARFASKKDVDPRDESQFTRPVRLHRRDPRRGQDAHVSRFEDPDAPPMDEAEREAFDARRAAREKERAENMAQIAPALGTTSKRPNAPKQKTQQVFKSDMTPEEVAKMRIKYEEALQWHLEDFDNKHTWVGNYEAALSGTHAVFVLEGGKMRMIPAEKWYKFSAKSNFKALTIEEAEKFMAKKVKDPRWFMEKQQELEQKKELDIYAKQRKVYAGKQGIPTSGGAGLEAGEMDFEEDRFADDEEHDDGLFNDDEDAKEAEKRIKEDQLKANVFDLKDEKDYEAEEKRELREREARHVLGKSVRKALKRREKNFDYSSGSENNPYSDDEVGHVLHVSPIYIGTVLTFYRRVPMTPRPRRQRKRSARRLKPRKRKNLRPRAPTHLQAVPNTQTPSRNQPLAGRDSVLPPQTQVEPTHLARSPRRPTLHPSPRPVQCHHPPSRYVQSTIPHKPTY
mgnify:CR=1 FL=1